MFDQRLQVKILNVVDVSYGGENGFNQAIELSAEILANVKFIQEKKLIGKYFEEISQDTGKYVFGVDDTLKALEMGPRSAWVLIEPKGISSIEHIWLSPLWQTTTTTSTDTTSQTMRQSSRSFIVAIHTSSNESKG
jgi:peptide subunit release factor 1 (eRF1)